jgi:type I restriction enzyme S subunit
VELNPGYRQTEVGVIPEDWRVKQVRDLKPFVTSGSRGWAAYYSDRGSLFIRITNLSRETIYLNLEDLRFVNLKATDSEASRTQLQDEDVLISITADIGIIGYVSPRVRKPAYINQHIALMRFDPGHSNSKFISYFLASGKPQGLFRALTDSGAKAGMNLTAVQQIHLALPPTKAEQNAIADALSDMDALIESLEELTVKKRYLKQSALHEMLTGKKRLPGYDNTRSYKQTESGLIPEDWDSTPLGELGHWKGGATPSMRNARYWVNGTVPWVSSGDVKSSLISDTPMKITESAVKESSTTVLPSHSILIVTRSGILRRHLPVAKNTCPMAINQDIKALTPSRKAIPDYLLQLLISSGPQILARCLKSGTTVESIELPWLKAFQVPLPPTKAEQQDIAGVLSDMDADLDALEDKLAKARHLKLGMMEELLTGRSRII